MKVVRRRLFWKIYLTLLASLIATVMALGAFFWFVNEAQREVGGTSQTFGPSQVSQYAADGHLVGARGSTLTSEDYKTRRRFGPGHIVRFDLPDGGFLLARFGPSGGVQAWRFLVAMLAMAGAIGLAAYPLTALLTRRLERLRAGVAQWGEDLRPTRLDMRGSDEVALVARAFNTAAARLDTVLASQKALLANASHELRSPLARLRVAVEVGRGEASAKDAASHAEIVQNLAEMDQLVDELLLSSRLDHPESRQTRRDSIDLLGLAAEEAARFDALVEGESVEIVGDAVLLRRLMRNLLENGAKHGRPPISILVARDADGPFISIGDEGRGVAPQDRERIFEPFYRPAGASEGAGGWGLGLALVRQIAERHGGSATCEANMSGGSRFVIRLATT